MSVLTPALCTMQTVSHQIGKTVEQIASRLDDSQLELAAYDLGRLEVLGEQITALARSSKDPLWQMAQDKRK